MKDRNVWKEEVINVQSMKKCKRIIIIYKLAVGLSIVLGIYIIYLVQIILDYL